MGGPVSPVSLASPPLDIINALLFQVSSIPPAAASSLASEAEEDPAPEFNLSRSHSSSSCLISVFLDFRKFLNFSVRRSSFQARTQGISEQELAVARIAGRLPDEKLLEEKKPEVHIEPSGGSGIAVICE
ncbi:hypothetical protein ACLOJK_008620 [Asimina triloba]